MAYYRLYFFDGRSHIRQAVELECESDGAATEIARAHADGREMELWNRDRLVWRQSAQASDAPEP